MRMRARPHRSESTAQASSASRPSPGASSTSQSSTSERMRPSLEMPPSASALPISTSRARPTCAYGYAFPPSPPIRLVHFPNRRSYGYAFPRVQRTRTAPPTSTLERPVTVRTVRRFRAPPPPLPPPPPGAGAATGACSARGRIRQIHGNAYRHARPHLQEPVPELVVPATRDAWRFAYVEYGGPYGKYISVSRTHSSSPRPCVSSAKKQAAATDALSSSAPVTAAAGSAEKTTAYLHANRFRTCRAANTGKP